MSHRTRISLIAVAMAATVGAAVAVPTITFAADNNRGPQVAALSGRAASQPASITRCLNVAGIRCYSPPQLLNAYGIDQLHSVGVDGRGTKIAILMSPSPTLQQDLNAAAKMWNLPKTKIKFVRPFGTVPFAPTAFEEATLDTQASHFVAPGAKLLFVEIPNAAEGELILQDQPLATAIDSAVTAGADVISMSFGGLDVGYPQFAAAIARAHKKGIAVVTGSGDTGPIIAPGATTQQTDYPAADPIVTAVGGTLMTLGNSGNRLIPDIAWGPDIGGGASGGGVSTMFKQPTWQRGVTGTSSSGRSYPDFSMNGAVSSSLLIAITAQLGTGSEEIVYLPIGGTSEAAPLFAGVAALATQVSGKRLPNINRALYSMARNRPANGIADVVQGNNTYGDVTGFPARTGFDLVTGVGTVADAGRFIRALARSAK